MFRPCIDLRQGKVTQIVGATLGDEPGQVRTHFIAERDAAWYAARYRADGLRGGHLIRLGPGNDDASRAALAAYPHGLQIGGGIEPQNARTWLEAGASHVIVTSYLFRDGELDPDRLRALCNSVGRDRLVLDLSCRWRDERYWVVTDRWQRFTGLALARETLASLAPHCAEFLVHAVDKEGLCRGVDLGLVERLAQWSPLPVTYAGGARSLDDLAAVTVAGGGRVDLTIGSALDIFGGTGVRYQDAVAYNRAQAARQRAAPPEG